tara:strand:- start:252 stop:845 length:594 start_codon:yes stop_codon:yes gene_type:complete
MTFTLPDLSYAYDALEPYIDAKTMQIHHTKHHQAYVDKLNAAIQGTDLEGKNIKEILSNTDSLPEEKRTAIINNGGGHANHSMFWEIIGGKGGEPTGKISELINDKFSSFKDLKTSFNEAATTRFGSGWAWLVMDKNNELQIKTTPNQDSPLMDNEKPLLCLDVWEHAYYLKYQNQRPKYIEAFWNLVDWEKVNSLL